MKSALVILTTALFANAQRQLVGQTLHANAGAANIATEKNRFDNYSDYINKVATVSAVD